MLGWESEPLTPDNVAEQFEQQGAVTLMQGPILQVSLLQHHYAFRWVALPDELDAWCVQGVALAAQMATVQIDLGASSVEQCRLFTLRREQGVEYLAVADLEQLLAQHRQLAEALQVERILLSVRMHEGDRALVCDYIV